MVVLTDFEEFNSVPRLRAAVYYSDFAQQIIENAAVSD